MKLFGRPAPDLLGYLASEVTPGLRLAAGRYQEFGMSNVPRHGEIVAEVDHIDGLVYITGEREPGWSWTLEPTETVVIERES